METQRDTRTVVGVFSDYNTAREAARELTAIGIPESAIDIHSDRKTGAAGYGTTRDGDSYETGDTSGSGNRESGITGWFHRTFGSDDSDETRGYSDAVSTGRSVMSVSAPAGQIDSVVDILNRYGSADIQSTRETTDSQDQSGSIPVVEEELTLGKRAVRRGGVRVYSRIVEQPVSEQIQLREEHVRVQRRPVDRALTPEETSGLRDQTIEVTETAEEAVVGKRARVREEILVGKDTTERTETVKDTVRRTEVRVEDMAGDRKDIDRTDSSIPRRN